MQEYMQSQSNAYKNTTRKVEDICNVTFNVKVLRGPKRNATIWIQFAREIKNLRQ